MRVFLSLTLLVIASTARAGQITYATTRPSDPPPPPPASAKDLQRAKTLADQLQQRMKPARQSTAWAHGDPTRR
ncbi:MAG: hypothetical protein U0807_09725 [Candidatus Binatia bacterium]